MILIVVILWVFVPIAAIVVARILNYFADAKEVRERYESERRQQQKNKLE